MRPRRLVHAACAMAGILAFLAGVACSEREEVGRPTASPSDSADVVSVDLATAERIVGEYFLALVQRRPVDARNLLAAGPRSDMSEQEMEAAARALREVRFGAFEPVDTGGERLVFRVELEVVPEPDHPGEWSAGLNTRWIELVHDRRGWRILQISATPIATPSLSPVLTWTRVHILEADLSLEVPQGWVLVVEGGSWEWMPEGGGPRVGVRWVEEVGADSTSWIPEGTRVVQSAALTLEWGAGTEYLLEAAPAGPGVVEPARQVLATVRGVGVGSGVVFSARPRAPEELTPLRSVLNRMVRSVEVVGSSSVRSSRDHR